MVTCLKAKKLCLLSQTKVNGAVMFRMCVERFGVIDHEVGSTLRRADRDTPVSLKGEGF
jgi:hypothetical protein